MADPCPGENTLSELNEWRLPITVAVAVEAHVSACDRCAETLEVLASLKLPESSELAPGDHFSGYEVLEQLGAGAMGVVYLARDLELDRKVALKVLRPHPQVSCERMLDEAKHLARLSHPHVVTIHDAGQVEGRPFLVMEWVQGETLDAWLAKAPRAVDEVLCVLREAGEGLHAAHAMGIVHRDFKPANILVGTDGRTRVADFGLSVRGGIDHAGAGTPKYMPPEQKRVGIAEASADQYAFCAVLSEAVALEQLPKRTRAAVRRGLDPDPAKRHPSMQALLHTLSTPGAPRWRKSILLSALAGFAVLVFVGAWHQARPSHPCEASSRLEGVWDSALEARLQAARPPSAWRALAFGARRYARDWSNTYERACKANSPALPCLEERREELRQLGAALLEARTANEENAFNALSPPRWCEHAARRVEPDRAKEPRLRLAQAIALRAAGRPRASVEVSDGVGREAQALQDEALQLDALFESALARSTLGDVSNAETDLRQAAALAEALGDDFRRAQTLIELVWVVGARKQDFAAAQLWAELATPILARLARPAELQSLLANNLGFVLAAQGRHREAKREYLRALSFEGDHAATWNNLALLQRDTGDAAEALTSFARARSLLVEAKGPTHRDTLLLDVNVAVLEQELGRVEKSVPALEQLRAVFEELDGAQSLTVARLDYECAGGWLQLEELARARAGAERAVSVLTTTLGADHPSTLRSTGLLGVVLTKQHEWEAAEQVLLASLAKREEKWGGTHPQVVLGLTQLAALKVEQQRAGEALPLLARAWEAHESAPLRRRVLASRIRGLQADALRQLGRSEESVLRARQALELTPQGENSVLLRRAKARLRQGST